MVAIAFDKSAFPVSRGSEASAGRPALSSRGAKRRGKGAAKAPEGYADDQSPYRPGNGPLGSGERTGGARTGCGLRSLTVRWQAARTRSLHVAGEDRAGGRAAGRDHGLDYRMPWAMAIGMATCSVIAMGAMANRRDEANRQCRDRTCLTPFNSIYRT